GTQTVGSPFLCLLSFGEAKESELPPGNPRPAALSKERERPKQDPAKKSPPQTKPQPSSAIT
ncbi:hypothetical protein, partial [Polaromonas sp. YR568]|uniref:hypothetical protein n=1 Tax=Polaromonas sp. YR568 TaxID=1855301 RepID=UPI001C311FE3